MKGRSIATGLLVLVFSSCCAAQEEAHPPLPLENNDGREPLENDRVEEIPVESNHQRQPQDENHIYQQQHEREQEHEHEDDSLGHEKENTLENPKENTAQEKPNVSHNEQSEQQEQNRHQEEDRLNSHQQTDPSPDYDEGTEDSLQQNDNSPPMVEPRKEHPVENDPARAAPENPQSEPPLPKEPLFSSEKTSPFTAGQLRKLLQHLEDEEAAEAEQLRLITSTEEGEEMDDRTLLDMFGQVAKEFLTQKVVSIEFRLAERNTVYTECDDLVDGNSHSSVAFFPKNCLPCVPSFSSYYCILT